MCLSHQIAKESQAWQNFESMPALFVICSFVTTLHSCYMRTHSFSANQKCVIFSCTLLTEEKKTILVTEGILEREGLQRETWLSTDNSKTKIKMKLCT